MAGPSARSRLSSSDRCNTPAQGCDGFQDPGGPETAGCQETACGTGCILPAHAAGLQQQGNLPDRRGRLANRQALRNGYTSSNRKGVARPDPPTVPPYLCVDERSHLGRVGSRLGRGKGRGRPQDLVRPLEPQDPHTVGLWTWLITAAHAQPHLARPLAEDLRRPWERRPAEPHRLTTPASAGVRHLPRHEPGKIVKRAETLTEQARLEKQADRAGTLPGRRSPGPHRASGGAAGRRCGGSMR